MVFKWRRHPESPHPLQMEVPREEFEATVHLVSAAGDMYDALDGAGSALHEILHKDMSDEEDWGSWKVWAQDALDALTKATKKAEGEEG